MERYKDMVNNLKLNEYILFRKKKEAAPYIKFLSNPTEEDYCIRINEETYDAKLKRYPANGEIHLDGIVYHYLRYMPYACDVLAVRTPMGIEYLLGTNGIGEVHQAYRYLTTEPSNEREWVCID